jgi:hypothetical protein
MSECDLSDTVEHHSTMTAYARECDVIVEFGVSAGGSTRAFLKGVKGVLHSWDIEPCSGTRAAIQDPKWHFHQGDSKVADIPECDMLYIDSEHTKAQVAAELGHAHKVRRWIMLHDSVTYMGEVLPPVLRFLSGNRGWMVREHFENNNGLLVLERV